MLLLKKVLIGVFIFFDIIIILAAILFINNGMSEGIKEVSKIRVDLLYDPFNINIAWGDKILNVSLSSFNKLGVYIRDVLVYNIINPIQDTFIYTNVY